MLCTHHKHSIEWRTFTVREINCNSYPNIINIIYDDQIGVVSVTRPTAARGSGFGPRTVQKFM
jgi:hypothetical protein